MDVEKGTEGDSFYHCELFQTNQCRELKITGRCRGGRSHSTWAAAEDMVQQKNKLEMRRGRMAVDIDSLQDFRSNYGKRESCSKNRMSAEYQGILFGEL